jgi:hypothetical protein
MTDELLLQIRDHAISVIAAVDAGDTERVGMLLARMYAAYQNLTLRGVYVIDDPDDILTPEERRYSSGANWSLPVANSEVAPTVVSTQRETSKPTL